MGCPQGGAWYTPLHLHRLGTVQASVTCPGCIGIPPGLGAWCGAWGVGRGVLLFPRIYAHACHPPPRPAGVAWGCVVCAGCAWCGVRCAGVAWCVPVYMHTLVTPPRRGGGVAGCAVCGVGLSWGVPVYMHTAVTPPPGKGHKKERGGPVAAPPLWGCAYFWLLFMPPRLRMVASVSAISSGV